MPLHRHASRLCAAPICLYSLKSLLYIACGQLKRDRSAVRAEAYAWVVHHRIADIFDVRDIVLTPRLDSSLAGCLKQRPLVHVALRAFCAVSAAAQRGEYLHEYVPGRRLLDLRRTRGQLYSERFLIGIERKPGMSSSCSHRRLAYIFSFIRSNRMRSCAACLSITTTPSDTSTNT